MAAASSMKLAVPRGASGKQGGDASEGSSSALLSWEARGVRVRRVRVWARARARARVRVRVRVGVRVRVRGDGEANPNPNP